MALRAAFSIAVIIIGVANTCGSIASLNWLARCAGRTRSVNVPFAPNGIGCMRYYSHISTADIAGIGRLLAGSGYRRACAARRLVVTSIPISCNDGRRRGTWGRSSASSPRFQVSGTRHIFALVLTCFVPITDGCFGGSRGGVSGEYHGKASNRTGRGGQGRSRQNDHFALAARLLQLPAGARARLRYRGAEGDAQALSSERDRRGRHHPRPRSDEG